MANCNDYLSAIGQDILLTPENISGIEIIRRKDQEAG
jgi:hypothetical protein